MIKRCQTCSTTIDSGIICDDCYKPNVMQIAIGPNTVTDERVSLGNLIYPDLAAKERIMTLPTDSLERKNYPILSGCINYFPAALAGVAKVSKAGNDKHNPGQALHHARGKSTDHADCIVRHLIDVQDILAQGDRSALTPKGIADLLTEASSLAWRALAYSQELHEKFGAPLAPGAKNEQ